LIRSVHVGVLMTGVVILWGCKPQGQQGAPGAGMQAMPVQTQAVVLSPVQQSTDYVATIKSRRSVTLMPQVDGNLTQILVKSGDHVKAGQPVMTVDPIRQQALVDSQQATENQKKALYDYNVIQVDRQRKLFQAGVTSRDSLDQAEQAFLNSKADWQAAIATRKSLEEQLAYYRIKAPFDGVIGDVPVHVGDYVTSSTALTTVDENKDLEAYIYVPTERASEAHIGLPVELLDDAGNVTERSSVDFLSPQIDVQTQGILLKAPVKSGSAALRSAQLVKARVIWKNATAPLIPVLAVTRQGGQTFVFLAAAQGAGHFVAKQVAVTLGDTVGNSYAVTAGIKPGDQIIVSGTQYLVDNMPVMPHS
jgi:RND family efflux transporter MFP subunit